MAIEAVVFDIGGVLEIIDDSIFPGPWPARLGLSEEELASRLLPVAEEGAVGAVTELQTYDRWRHLLGLDDAALAEFTDDCWRWYVGTLDRPLADWFAAQRPQRRTGILSNSGPGAREHERLHGFEEITDDIVYSHEVGLVKPDPRIYALTAERLDVRPHEVLFLDDVEGHVSAARAAGWHAVLHTSTPGSIAAMEQVLARSGVS